MGLIVAPDLERGFSSNGKESKVSFVDLKTFRTISKIETGANPDVRVYRFPHRVGVLLQSVSRLGRARNLRIQCDHAINHHARIDRDLLFLPGNIQIDRAEIFSRCGFALAKMESARSIPKRR